MKQEIRILEDDDYDLNDNIAPEYDIPAMRARAKAEGREYNGQFAGKGVRLAPDVAEVFSDSEAVNEALRTLIRLSRAQEQKAA